MGGVIKDYDGGTLMQCTMIRGVNYLDWYHMIYEQQRRLLALVDAKTGMGRVYPGLKGPVNPIDVPGVRELGWKPSTPPLSTTGRLSSTLLAAGVSPGATASPSEGQSLVPILASLLDELKAHPASWPFRQPVDLNEVPDYLSVITTPMDLSTMEAKLKAGQYQSIEEFVHDFELIPANCRRYNEPDTTYCKNATLLEKFFRLKSRLREHLTTEKEAKRGAK